MYRYLVRTLLCYYTILLAVASGVRCALGRSSRRAPLAERGTLILATGTFFSANWLRSHVLPILDSPRCGTLILACDAPLIEHEKLENRCPSRWLRRLIGRVPARAVLLFGQALRRRPDYIIGYHLLPNAMLALLAARVSGARAVYQCCGGECELDGGGSAMRENGLLKRVKVPDSVIAARLRGLIPHFDAIVTRGQKASAFFERCGASGPVTVITAGVDDVLYASNGDKKDFDLITVGRLAEVKRLDLFLDIVAELGRRGHHVRAAIVGDGPERVVVEARIAQLQLGDQVTLTGHQENVAEWMNRARVFVLTSDSEGLSIALAEAMMVGVPAVVSDVGDLSMLVSDGESGYLVPRQQTALFVEQVARLLIDDQLRARFSGNARARARALCSRSEVTRRWTQILSE